MKPFVAFTLTITLLISVDGQADAKHVSEARKGAEKAAPAARPREVLGNEKFKKACSPDFERVAEDALKKVGITDLKQFGEAWRTPDGTIWSNIATNPDGSPKRMNHEDATAYCKQLGARLPTGYPDDKNGTGDFPVQDSDVVTLRRFMGAKNSTTPDGLRSYRPQVLPRLEGFEKVYDSEMWTSSAQGTSSNHYVFNGAEGYTSMHFAGQKRLVRCVTP